MYILYQVPDYQGGGAPATALWDTTPRGEKDGDAQEGAPLLSSSSSSSEDGDSDDSVDENDDDSSDRKITGQKNSSGSWLSSPSWRRRRSSSASTSKVAPDPANGQEEYDEEGRVVVIGGAPSGPISDEEAAVVAGGAPSGPISDGSPGGRGYSKGSNGGGGSGGLMKQIDPSFQAPGMTPTRSRMGNSSGGGSESYAMPPLPLKSNLLEKRKNEAANANRSGGGAGSNNGGGGNAQGGGGNRNLPARGPMAMSGGGGAGGSSSSYGRPGGGAGGYGGGNSNDPSRFAEDIRLNAMMNRCIEHKCTPRDSAVTLSLGSSFLIMTLSCMTCSSFLTSNHFTSFGLAIVFPLLLVINSAESDPISGGGNGNGGRAQQQRVLGQRSPRFGTTAFFKGLRDSLCGVCAKKKKKAKKDKKKVKCSFVQARPHAHTRSSLLNRF